MLYTLTGSSKSKPAPRPTTSAANAAVKIEVPGPVKITDLGEYVQKKKSGEDSSFFDDYQVSFIYLNLN